jgi:hypothetical protein
VLSGEAANTNIIIFGLTQQGLKPMICHTLGEHANHNIVDAVISQREQNKLLSDDVHFVLDQHTELDFL